MEEKLTLNDGTELAGHVIESDGRLYVYLDNSTLTETFEALNDPEKTAEITAERYSDVTVYEDFTRLKAVSDEGGGVINAVLMKEV